MEFRETNTSQFRISYFGRWRGVWHVSLRNTSGATLWIDDYEVPPNGNIDYEICPRGRRPLAFDFDVGLGSGRQFFHLGWGTDSGRVGLLLRDRYGTGRWFLEDRDAVAKPIVLPLAPAMAAPLEEAATAPLPAATAPKTCGHACHLHLETCCACSDMRPIAAGYLRYIDGIGTVMDGARHDGYCSLCKARAPAVVEEAEDDTDVRDFYRLVLQQVYFRDTALLVGILRSQGLPMDAFLRAVSLL
jgi:hypothetical protein